jgi:hypothetical protein
MQRRHDLEQHEHRADDGQRSGQAVAALDGANQHAHRDPEHRWQNAAKQEQRPPGEGNRIASLGQGREERPFLPLAKNASAPAHSPRFLLHRL